MILFFLPGILYRLPDKIETLLDLGAGKSSLHFNFRVGPTVYIPISVRHRAFNIFTSDYAQCNRETTTAWIKNEGAFDWTNVCKWIESIESSRETPEMMQTLARSRMRAVLNVSRKIKAGKCCALGKRVQGASGARRSFQEGWSGDTGAVRRSYYRVLFRIC